MHIIEMNKKRRRENWVRTVNLSFNNSQWRSHSGTHSAHGRRGNGWRVESFLYVFFYPTISLKSRSGERGSEMTYIKLLKHIFFLLTIHDEEETGRNKNLLGFLFSINHLFIACTYGHVRVYVCMYAFMYADYVYVWMYVTAFRIHYLWSTCF